MRSKRFMWMMAMLAAAIFAFATYGGQPVLSQPNGSEDSDSEDDIEVPDPEDFVRGVNNPYFPLVPGSQYAYEGTLDDGSIERIEIEILRRTRQIMGVTATILRDRVFVDGELVEDTRDWFAQDEDGNVWYLGEAVDNYENGKLVNHDGSWEWGVDGALPGIIMWARPARHIGEVYYQEYYPGVAEDQAQVLSVRASVSVPYGSFDRVAQTYDFTALDPEAQEHKFYAPGIGLVKEVDLVSGEEAVLISYRRPRD
jgi:hypothetical protein